VKGVKALLASESNRNDDEMEAESQANKDGGRREEEQE
jgi:hypothetical protein